ncbi:MAG TPA: DUF4136 domain-containing protein [Bacteroidales bacterium]|jgi:hypothetical protein|nr:DUF4136 domain-containing protein [Bacteroidales bacterium]
MKNLSFLLLVALVLSACSGIKVVSDMDPSVNFNDHKTLEYYGWVEESDQIMNRFDKERIENAFASEFKSRGIEVVEQGQGDIVVALYIVTEEKTQKSASTTHHGGYGGYGYGGYYGYGPGWGWGGGHSTTTISEYAYLEGTLVCSVFDKATEQLIWEGIGTKTISEDPKRRERNIPEAVKRIMAQYPVKPLSSK